MKVVKVIDSSEMTCDYYGIPLLKKGKQQYILCKFLYYPVSSGVYKNANLLKISNLILDDLFIPKDLKFKPIGESMLIHGKIRKRGKLKWKLIEQAELEEMDLIIPYFRIGKLPKIGEIDKSVSVISLSDPKAILVSSDIASKLSKFGHHASDFATYKANFMWLKYSNKEEEFDQYFDMHDIKSSAWKSWAYEQVFGIRPDKL